MAQVYVKYNPYKLETEIRINGQPVPTDSELFRNTKGKRLQEWIGDFPLKLRNTQNTMDFSLEFHGMPLDWDDFSEAFRLAEKQDIIHHPTLRFTQGKSDEDITEKIKQVFQDLQEGPIEDFRDPRLQKAFASVENAVFPINVIATMSSGKSTLINAMLGKSLMPAKNEACTATITELLDNDREVFQAVVYGEDEVVLGRVDELTYAIMQQLNDDKEVIRIRAEGEIPFLDSRTTALQLVDTPGPNNARTSEHQETTYRALNNSSNNLILYVLNGTQLSTNDDARFLRYVAEQMKQGGKQMRDRFLFVINKMDQFNPETESIERVMESARSYLADYGIQDPQIFPCSAYVALSIREHLQGIDIDNLTRSEERKLPVAAQDAITAIYKLVDYNNMHLEQYTTLAPSAQAELDARLQRAVEANDTKEQALIHSGICSIEAAITAYVKKYARTKKVKDLVETFQEVLDSYGTLTKAREQIAGSQAAAQEVEARYAEIEKRIADGKEAQKFKTQINALDPMPQIQKTSDKLLEDADRKVLRPFASYSDTITSESEAKRLVKLFVDSSTDALAELSVELDSVINREIVEAGSTLLEDYQARLTQFDNSAGAGTLDFSTVDLIKGALHTMQDKTATWTSDGFAAQTVEEFGETIVEVEEYHVIVGQKEEQVVVGSHEEAVGTERVKVGTERKKTGTRRIKNPVKRFFKFVTRQDTTEDVYEDVDVFEDRTIYKTVLDYKTVYRDVFEKRTRENKKFSVEVSDLQMELLSNFKELCNNGIQEAMKLAEDAITQMKVQFSSMFDELDRLVQEKYKDLRQYGAKKEESAKLLKENELLVNFIEDNQAEIREILDI